MRSYRADLHIHSVLSPCGDLEMSPRNIVAQAQAREIDIIAITDHNSTKHGPVVRRMAEPLGITVLFGAEVTTKEEVHCLCLFDEEEQRVAFQGFIDKNLPNYPNDPKRFGHQVVVNEKDEILEEIEPLLISALRANVEQVEREVHTLGGLFIPAHVDRPMFSLISQLGFIPSDLKFDALEIFRNTNPIDFKSKHSYLGDPVLIKNSDSHFPNQIGSTFTEYMMQSPNCKELKMAFQNEEGRFIIISSQKEGSL
jgi:3',5'-nucleoside bisphosphate phosphatase